MLVNWQGKGLGPLRIGPEPVESVLSNSVARTALIRLVKTKTLNIWREVFKG